MLLDDIKADLLEARKARTDTIRINVLTTLVGEATKIGKDDGDRVTTDSEVTALIRKFIKNLEDTLNTLGATNRISISGGRADALRHEITTLQEYVPSQLTEDQLRTAVDTLNKVRLLAHENPLTLKDTGFVMKQLNEMFPGQIDGKKVSEIIKSLGT